jgi:hypothetical protein
MATVVAGATLLVAACAQGGDRLQTAVTSSVIATATPTVAPTSVTSQQVAPNTTGIQTPAAPTGEIPSSATDGTSASSAANGLEALPGISACGDFSFPIKKVARWPMLNYSTGGLEIYGVDQKSGSVDLVWFTNDAGYFGTLYMIRNWKIVTMMPFRQPHAGYALLASVYGPKVDSQQWLYTTAAHTSQSSDGYIFDETCTINTGFLQFAGQEPSRTCKASRLAAVGVDRTTISAKPWGAPGAKLQYADAACSAKWAVVLYMDEGIADFTRIELYDLDSLKLTVTIDAPYNVERSNAACLPIDVEGQSLLAGGLQDDGTSTCDRKLFQGYVDAGTIQLG